MHHMHPIFGRHVFGSPDIIRSTASLIAKYHQAGLLSSRGQVLPTMTWKKHREPEDWQKDTTQAKWLKWARSPDAESLLYKRSSTC